MMEEANALLNRVYQLVQGEKVDEFDATDIKVGIDLGTASIVLVVVDKNNQPIFAASQESSVVKDGLVVDYLGAVRITQELKKQAEEVLGLELTSASGAIPPGTVGNNKSVVKHVIEACGMECVSIIDEPTAAAVVLNIDNGAVIDVGGGTTGISIIQNGKVVYSKDEPTGGTQMTLVLAGYYGISIPEAEQLKRDYTKTKMNFPILKPVVEKMAQISLDMFEEFGNILGTVYIVGGAIKFDECEKIFEKFLNWPISKPLYPEYVTPLGIAMSMNKK